MSAVAAVDVVLSEQEVRLTVPQLRQLVGNPSAYAVQSEDGTYRPVRKPITSSLLSSHLSGTLTIGTYVLWGDRARTLVFDVDAEDAEDARAQVRVVTTALMDLGLPRRFIGIEASGRKGYHVWVVASTYLPARTLRRIGLAIRDEANLPRLEVFPKQDRAMDLGNLVKLPGGVHRVTGRPNNFIGPFPQRVPVAKLEELASKCPNIKYHVAGNGSFGEPPFPCISRTMEHGPVTGYRNNQLFHLAVMLRKGGVTDEYVRHIVFSANQKAQHPLPELEVEQLFRSSRASGPICHSLPEDLHCGDKCILKKTQGLYTRPGRVRYAAEGEHVVLRVASRDGNIVDFEHEDLRQARGILAPQEDVHGD